MLYVRIELWPGGDRTAARVLGEGTISNVTRRQMALGELPSDRDPTTVGDYVVELMKSPEYAKSSGVWKRGRVEGFPRTTLGPWDLLFRALAVTVGYRNRRPVRDEVTR
jgi:hypothetical protein